MGGCDSVAGERTKGGAGVAGGSGGAGGSGAGGDPTLDAAAVEELVAAFGAALTDAGASAEGVTAITAGVRAVLSERCVGRLLRWLHGAHFGGGAGGGATGAADSDAAVAAAVEAALATHRRTECDGCGTVPIVGTRYRATNRDDYDLCGVCYAAAAAGNPPPGAAGVTYEAVAYPWLAAAAVTADTTGEAARVPAAPLRFYARGPRVAHLQAVLLAAGYLSPRAVARRVGFYGPHTRAAVAAAQGAAGVLGEVLEVGMYDATTRDVLLARVLALASVPLP